MRLTEEEFAKLRKAAAPAMPRAKGGRRRRIPGEMNKTESAFVREYVEPRIHTGELVDYWFESFKFKLANKTWAEVDFMLQDKDGYLFLVDTKGTKRVTRKSGQKAEIAHTEDDAAVKLKVLPYHFPFPVFIAFRSRGGEWVLEEK